MKKTKVKKLAIIVIAIILIFTLSAFIYAGTVEKTTIVCEDANLYKLLKNSLNKYIVCVMFLVNRSIILHDTVYTYSIIFTCSVKRSFPSQSLAFLNKL